MSDNVITFPSGSVKTFEVDNDTLKYFHFASKERMEKVTLRINESVTSDIVMRLPRMKELHLQKLFINIKGNWASVDNYPSLCNLIHTHFPHLARLTFNKLRIGNRKAKSILLSLITHPHPQSLRYTIIAMPQARPV